jgi:enterochelin esterase-like enzyme
LKCEPAVWLHCLFTDMTSKKTKHGKDIGRILNSNQEPGMRDYDFLVVDRSTKAGFLKLEKAGFLKLEIVLSHHSNGFSRKAHIVLPPDSVNNQKGIVVFMTDGQLATGFAEWMFESLQVSSLPPISFFGLDCNDDGFKRRDRAIEYLGAEDEELFVQHYEAFVNVLPNLAKQLLQVELTRDSSVIAGSSNGGAFAYRMAVEHPELFGNAILMSPQRTRQPVDLSRLGKYRTKFYLIAGETDLERLFKKNTLRIKEALDQAGMRNSFLHDPTRGHNFYLWANHFPTAIHWLFDEPPLGVI